MSRNDYYTDAKPSSRFTPKFTNKNNTTTRSTTPTSLADLTNRNYQWSPWANNDNNDNNNKNDDDDTKKYDSVYFTPGGTAGNRNDLERYLTNNDIYSPIHAARTFPAASMIDGNKKSNMGGGGGGQYGRHRYRQKPHPSSLTSPDYYYNEETLSNASSNVFSSTRLNFSAVADGGIAKTDLRSDDDPPKKNLLPREINKRKPISNSSSSSSSSSRRSTSNRSNSTSNPNEPKISTLPPAELPSASSTAQAAFANVSEITRPPNDDENDSEPPFTNPTRRPSSSSDPTRILENRRSNVPLSIRLLSSSPRTDASGAGYTAYVMKVGERKTLGEEEEGDEYETREIEHRYSEFAKLNRELEANGVVLDGGFPMKHWAGRIGDWTPSKIWAPQQEQQLIRTREIKLDYWLVELSEKLQHCTKINGSLRKQVLEFLSVSSATVPPCDRANFINWDLDDTNTMTYYEEDESYGPSSSSRSEVMGEKHAGILQKYISNPLSFTLGSSIRQAAYTVLQMCGKKSTFSYNGNQTDQSIPLDLLHQARGLCFLSVVKGGFVMSVRGGTGLIIVRKKDGTWTAPSAIGTVGLGWGALIGGDITNYLIVLNTDNAVKAFAQPSGTVNLGAELGVAVGPVGRGATGNINKASSGGLCAAYAYAHSKGLFAGISLEGSIVVSRPDVNSKFYGKPIDAQEILCEDTQLRPRAAQPLYDALDEAMTKILPEKGFRPSKVLHRARSYQYY